MSNDQVRKLLGGYATNSLTEAERKALFEAALEDQELFDALGHEQALKELLADPASRNQIQLALAGQPVASTRRVAWWSRGWAWGSLAGAMAAAVLIFAVVHSQQTRTYQAAVVERRAASPAQLEAPAAQSAPPIAKQPASKPSPRVRPTEIRAKEAPAPPPPPPARAPAPQVLPFRLSEPLRQQGGSTQGQVQVQAQAGAQVQDREQAVQGFRARLETAPASPNSVGDLTNTFAPLLRYALVKRDSAGVFSPVPPGATLESGDALQITVTSAVPGSLFLQRLGADGQWARVFPQSSQDLQVASNTPLTIPDSPIIIQDTELRFRLMLVPSAQQSGQAGGQSTLAATPLMREITIPAGKRP